MCSTTVVEGKEQGCFDKAALQEAVCPLVEQLTRLRLRIVRIGKGVKIIGVTDASHHGRLSLQKREGLP
ncbi:MAG: hypothetical protein JXJ04_10340 [Spirochaetales bacterium]|nr:hypothetical protein [Spirochaetales bacterium]